MTDAQIADAADLLWTYWKEGRRMAAIPETVRPATRAEGYAVQARLEGRSAAPLFGWKIAATSRAGQAHINVDGPLAGRLLAERVHAPGAVIPFGAGHMRVAEVEFAFRFGQDLLPRPAPFTVEDVLAAVSDLHPAIEVPDSRFEDFTVVGAPQLIADNACGHEFVLGEVAPSGWRDVDLAAHVVRGEVLDVCRREGTGANVLGDPRIALAWLVNELSALALPVRAGQVVTTGTCVVPLPIEPGASVRADFGAFGAVDVSFGA